MQYILIEGYMGLSFTLRKFFKREIWGFCKINASIRAPRRGEQITPDEYREEVRGSRWYGGLKVEESSKGTTHGVLEHFLSERDEDDYDCMISKSLRIVFIVSEKVQVFKAQGTTHLNCWNCDIF